MGRAEAYLHGPVRRAYLARRVQSDPTSRLAVWARRVAGFSVAVMLLGIVIVRAGILEIIPSLAAVGEPSLPAGLPMCDVGIEPSREQEHAWCINVGGHGVWFILANCV